MNPVHIQTLKAGSIEIGPGRPCFVIAEAGVNHNGEKQLAFDLVDTAVAAGADAVKFQTFKADRLVTRDAPQAKYQIDNIGEEEGQFAMLKKLELSDELHRELLDYCREKGIVFLSTPFDELSSDFLKELGLDLFKLPSGEATNIGYLQHLAAHGLPLILSTGMCDLAEVALAIEAIRGVDAGLSVALLHCTSNYPADPAVSNLRAMETMAASFGLPVGYSDHTEGIAVSLAAVARGAAIIEKHFTLDRTLPGPDHKASLEPAELNALVAGIRTVESALGDGIKRPVAQELDTARVARKSLVAARDLKAGEVLTKADIVAKRPGTGIVPGQIDVLIGRTLRRSMDQNELFAWDVLD